MAVLLFLVMAVLLGYVVYALVEEPEQEGTDVPEAAPKASAPAGAAWWTEKDLLPSERPHTPAPALVPDVDVVLTPGVAPRTAPVSIVTYESFKQLVSQPAFLEQFTDAVRACLRLKQTRYQALKKQTKESVRTFTKSNKKDFISATLDDAQNSQLNEARDLLGRIEAIQKILKARLDDCSVEDTRRRLQYALYKKDVGLESLQGRQELKDFVARRLYTFAQNPKVFLDSFQNTVLMSGPGTGKTRVAQVLAHVYCSAGLLVEGTPIITTKSALVSQFVNNSSHTTRAFLLSTLEHVAFIDEAYDLVPPPHVLEVTHRDHGHEAITEIVNHLDKMKGLTMMIVAGYESEMRSRFLASNEGMPRRFPNQLVLRPYTAEELTQIFVQMLLDTNNDLVWTEEMTNHMYTLIQASPGSFPAQAGDMLNLSTEVAQAIYSVMDPVWPEDWRSRLLDGMNGYLSKYNKHLE